MKCIEELKAEHRAVLVTLEILEKICTGLNNYAKSGVWTVLPLA